MRVPSYKRLVFAVSAVAVGLAAMASATFAASVPADGATTPGEAALQALIEQAKKEPSTVSGRVTLALTPIVEKANRLFNQRFGLNKRFNISQGVDNTFITQMMAALDLGGRPDLSFYATNGSDMPSFITKGYAAEIKDWEALLAEINPRVKSGAIKPTDISRAGYSGYGFAHSNRLKGVGYNTKLVTPKDLPSSYAEMADPKYKGQYAIEPWLSHWEALAFNYYPDRLDSFLKIMNTVGQNTYVVSRSHQLLPRMAQGEFKFMTLNAEVVTEFVAQNPGAPLDFYFMNDMTLVETTLMFVPPKSPAPASAALWVMYFSHPDVQALRGANAPNIMYGELESDVYLKQRLQGKHVWDWTDSDASLQYWKWMNSEDPKAKEFGNQMLEAVRQRK
jgi:hypothetical protein